MHAPSVDGEHGPAGDPAAGRMTPRRNVPAYRFLALGLLCLAVSAVAYGTLRVTFGPRPVEVHIKWAPGVADMTRQDLEQRYGLSQGEDLEDEGWWWYALTDPSRSNIGALVTDSAIVDTQDVQRDTFRVNRATLRLPYPTSHPWAPIRLGGIGFLCLAIGIIAIGFGLLDRVAPGRASAWFIPRPRYDLLFALTLLAALLIRLNSAATLPYIHDEDNASIPVSQSISFDPGNLHLPIRGENHPALTAYVVKFSSALFGDSFLGYRLLHVLSSLCVVVMVFVLTRQWYGLVAARWAAALLAFNEYFLGVSSRATAHVPYLLFASASVYAFGRFLTNGNAVYVYAASVALGVAFYAKELAALLVPLFLLMLLRAPYRHLFRGPHLYLAGALFLLVIGPDIAWNLTHGGEGDVQASYRDHLQRIGGIGFSPYPFMFFARDTTRWLYDAATGVVPFDPTSEYLSMNPALGGLLLCAVALTTLRPAAQEGTRFLLLLFWGVFGFFALMRPGGSPRDLDPVSWIWVDITLLPASILTGALLARTTGRPQFLIWTLACSALLYAGAAMTG